MQVSAGIFLTVKDLMRLLGSDSYDATRKEHAYVRLALCKKNKKPVKNHRITKRKLTIAEYCNYMGLNFSEIWDFLRPNQQSPYTSEKPEKTG